MLPFLSRAQLWDPPLLISTASLMLETVTGVIVVVPRPSPSCPEPPSPQHSTTPLTSNAHENALPLVVTATAVVIPLTATGTDLRFVVLSPSSPLSFQPQQRTPPERSTAQL